MNRRKKIIKKLQKKDKKANAKLHKSSKPVYVSKAEREKLAKQAASDCSSSDCSSSEQSISEQTDSAQRDKKLDSE